jgi:hypothetical protein
MKLEDGADYEMPDLDEEQKLRSALLGGGGLRRQAFAASPEPSLGSPGEAAQQRPEMHEKAHEKPHEKPQAAPAQQPAVPGRPARPGMPAAPALGLQEGGRAEPALLPEGEKPQAAADALLVAAPAPFFLPDDTPRASWLWSAAACFFVALLAGQWVWHDKAELARQLPAFGQLLAHFNVALPLPKDADKILIVSSNLEAGGAPGSLVLSVTLENNAAYPQAWPDLRLTLTDTFDTVLARKVLLPADYLPSRTDAASPGNAFAPGTLSLRLPLSVGNLNPAGYRLFLFYAS